MHIAIFGDVHGHLLLCFDLCARWQQATEKPIDLILQVGDLAAFPDRKRLDRATRRHSECDPSALGFADHFTISRPEIAARLSQTQCPLIFVRGHHEDLIWLDALERDALGSLFPVDAYERVYCLKTGVPYTFTRGDETLHLLGIGRIGRLENSPRQKLHYFQAYEQERLSELGDVPVDLLLTHDAARDEVFSGAGCEAISRILDRYRPCCHFFGHYSDGPRKHLMANGQTQSWLLADLQWEFQGRGQQLKLGSMGSLHWKHPEGYSFELVDLEALLPPDYPHPLTGVNLEWEAPPFVFHSATK